MNAHPHLDVMTCLRARMPITLLIDLLDPRGPDSREILHFDELGEPQSSPTTVLCRTSSSSAR